MPSAQIIIATTGSSVQTTAITTTKVRVSANAAVHYAVGSNPTAYGANCEIITANSVRYINMEGLGNKLAFLGSTNTAEVSVVNIGYVAPSTIVQVQSS